MSRRRHPYPVTAAVLAGAVVLFLWVLAHTILAVLPVLAGWACWRNRHAIARAWHRPSSSPRVVQGTVVAPHPEVVKLRADNARLRAQLADAQDAAHAAWDQAATVQPRHPGTALAADRERLASTPMSGARPLTGGGR